MDGYFIAIMLSFTAAAFFSLLAIRAFCLPAPKIAAAVKFRPEWEMLSDNDSGLLSRSFDAWFTRLVARAGLKIDRRSLILALGAASVLIGLAAMIADLPAMVQILSGLSAFAVGILIIIVLQHLRLKNFSMQFPAALELLARSVRAGEDLESAIASVARNSEDPVASEFKWCEHQLRLGLPPAQVVAGLADRMVSVDTRLFANTVAVHRGLGGRLSDSLDRLAAVIRDRIAQRERIRSITGIGRFAVIAILLMAIFVLIYLSWMHPEYIAKLYAVRLGRQMLVYAAVSEVVGIVWAVWTLKTEL